MNAHIHSTVFYRIVGMADIEQDFSIVKKEFRLEKSVRDNIWMIWRLGFQEKAEPVFWKEGWGS